MPKKTQQQIQQYRETIKYNLWVKYFLDPTNSETFGNATRSAILAYKYDPVKQYDVAAQIGSRNIKKVQSLSSVILEKLGYTFAEMMKIGMAKVINGSYSDWEKFMERLGVFEKDGSNQPPGNFTQVNVNLNDAIEADRKARGLPIITTTQKGEKK